MKYSDLTEEEKEKIEYMLSINIAPNVVSRYMGYDKRALNHMIPEYFVSPKPRISPKQNQIKNVLRLRKVLESGINTQYQLNYMFKDSTLYNAQIYKIAEEIWGYKLKRSLEYKGEKQRYFRIRYDYYIDMYKIRNGEDKAAEYFMKQGYTVYVLKNMGADFVIEKDNECIIVEVKTRIYSYTITESIVQLLYAKKMLKKYMNIESTKMIVFGLSEIKDKEAIKARQRYFDAFDILLHFCPVSVE